MGTMTYRDSIPFKPYDQNQATFLPPSLDELIPAGHQVRFVNKVVDQMNLDSVYATYAGGGTSSYHPRMMVKVLLYGYVQRIYSARKLAKALRENVHFMWLAAGQTPDFRTINDFRKSRLQPTLKELFTQLMGQLVELGLVDLGEYFIDGTKVEANARRHSAVWAKKVERHRVSVRRQIEELFDQIQQIAEAEDLDLGEADLPETGGQSDWDSADVEATVERINSALAQPESGDSREGNSNGSCKPGSPASRRRLRQLLRRLGRDKLPRLQRYEAQKRTLDGRNSYSKTDPEATFMRGKHQPFSPMQMRACYNLQLGTQNQFILGYSLHQNAGDKVVLAAHLDRLGFRPDALIGDGGYGSLANYEELNKRDIAAYLKYPGYDRRPSPYEARQMSYNLGEDAYICPQGQRISYRGDRIRKDGTRVRVYQSPDCNGCPVRAECVPEGQEHRKFIVNTKLNLWRNTMDRRLAGGLGEALKKRRSAEVESVFGQLKGNDGLGRLVMRGLAMGELEVGLKAMAHNLRRWHKLLTEGADRMAPALG